MTPTGRRPSQPELQTLPTSKGKPYKMLPITLDFTELEIRVMARFGTDRMSPLMECKLEDALNRECVPLDEDPDEDPMRFLAHDGIDHTTGLDSLFSPTHDGVLLCAGFAMMENEDD